MLKKSVFIIAILFVFLFIFSSCIIVTPASNSKSRPSPTSKPAPAKDKIIKGKFQVLVISKQIHFKDRSGVVYAISGLGKKDMSKLLKMDKKYISAEIKVPAKSKSKKKTAVFIRFL